MNSINLKFSNYTLNIKLRSTNTANAIKNILPFKSIVKTWGDEIYFEIPIKKNLDLESDAKDVINLGEIAYWMQLKSAFEQENIPFPILLLRNSALLISEKQLQKFESFGFKIEDIFLEETQLHKKYVQKQSSAVSSLQNEKATFNKIFNTISEKTADKGLLPTIKAEQQKQLKSLQKLEKKLLHSEKKKHENALNQISKIKKQLFPNNGFQERFDNFTAFYLNYGGNFIEILQEELTPLAPNFVILSLQSS